jgi:hypothetical protein
MWRERAGKVAAIELLARRANSVEERSGMRKRTPNRTRRPDHTQHSAFGCFFITYVWAPRIDVRRREIGFARDVDVAGKGGGASTEAASSRLTSHVPRSIRTSASQRGFRPRFCFFAMRERVGG